MVSDYERGRRDTILAFRHFAIARALTDEERYIIDLAADIIEDLPGPRDAKTCER